MFRPFFIYTINFIAMRLLITLLASLTLTIALAQDQTATARNNNAKWDVNNPPYPHKTIHFTTDEGTWMNLDISPDGRTLVFDLLGDIYSMPVTGGKATVLRQNLAYEVQPQFSPDGKKILFTSDAGGGDNIWMMDADGKNARQITRENFRLLNNACFTPDGQYFVARKHFTSSRSLGAGEMWLYHINGGDGLQLTKRKNDQQDVNEPSISPDGRYVYYSEDMYPGGHFQYNKDPNNEIFVINRYDREDGSISRVTGGPGGALRPQISNSGKELAFIRRVREKTVLYLHDLETGEEWPVYDKLSKDQAEAWTIFGPYTRYAWSPDDQFIYIWSWGKIWKIDVRKANVANEIPFTADVQQQIADVVRFQQDLEADDQVKAIRNAVTSPDGKMLVFNALGSLWKKTLPNGQPQRLTNSNDIEDEPAFSKDGRQLVYVTWNDAGRGAIQVMNLSGNRNTRVTTSKTIYRNPSFSPDGKTIVFEKSRGDNVLGNAGTANTGIYIMDADGKNEKLISKSGSKPHFSKNGARIYYQFRGNSFASNDLNGKDEKVIFNSTYGLGYAISPDENWVAFTDLHKAYIAANPGIGKTIDLNATSNAYPVKQVARDAGLNLHWSSDGKKLRYTVGNEYYTIELADRFGFIDGRPDSAFVMPERGVAIGLKQPLDKPTGRIALTNARIITMNGNEVIENGTVLVNQNKIEAVGASVNIPAGTHIIDCSGKTIMPGLIDAHAHGVHFRSGLTPQVHWPYYTALAFGNTTMHDPSANSEMVFAQSEMVKSGKMVGPRIFSTGTILYGAEGDFKAVINSLEDARSAIRRTKAFGAFSVKSYNQPRREQRQQVIQAARELNINVVPEGGSFFYHNMTMINDGHTTIEHNIPIPILYKDVINTWKESKTAYTPTLIVNYGGPNGEYYFYQYDNVWENERLMRFTPRNVVDTRARWRRVLPQAEYENGHYLVAESAKKLAGNGVWVNTGAHGQIQGIGMHWEMWLLSHGGMANHDVLKAATIWPALSLGLDKNIGSLQAGKLADIIVLDENPLTQIRNTETVRYTMINGRLFDAHTMNEMGNHPKERPKFYWEGSRNSNVFPWNDGETHHLDVD